LINGVLEKNHKINKMNWKFNTHYIVTKGSADGLILSGDTLLLNFHRKKDEYSTLGKWEMFLPVHEGEGESFYGLPQLNNVRYFSTKEKMFEALKDVEVIYNIKLAQKIIDEHQRKIDNVKKNHEII
jgi:hypothetical protein